MFPFKLFEKKVNDEEVEDAFCNAFDLRGEKSN